MLFSPPRQLIRLATAWCLLPAQRLRASTASVRELGSVAPTLRGLVVAYAALVAGLVGCQSPPPVQAAAAPPGMTGGLLAIRLLERTDPPKTVELRFVPVGQPSTGQQTVSARLQRSIPGQLADYYVPLPLPPGNYVLQQLRSAQAEPNATANVLANLDIPWTNDRPNPVYLGRLVVRLVDRAATPAELSIENHFDEDSVAIRGIAAELRDANISPNMLASALLGSAKPQAANGAGATLDVMAGQGNALLALNEPAHSAYARYLRLGLPRAFAASAEGAFGFAQGRNAVRNALGQCARNESALRKQRGVQIAPVCELLSVDRTVLTPGSCKAALADAAGEAGLYAGCASKRPKR